MSDISQHDPSKHDTERVRAAPLRSNLTHRWRVWTKNDRGLWSEDVYLDAAGDATTHEILAHAQTLLDDPDLYAPEAKLQAVRAMLLRR